jgi:transcription repressor NrdR-like protein
MKHHGPKLLKHRGGRGGNERHQSCPACKRRGCFWVIDSRTGKDGLGRRRRRACSKCGHRLTTYEFDKAAVDAALAQMASDLLARITLEIPQAIRGAFEKHVLFGRLEP